MRHAAPGGTRFRRGRRAAAQRTHGGRSLLWSPHAFTTLSRDVVRGPAARRGGRARVVPRAL
ncbi:hypothetical protein CA831_06965, partial [Burkholderia multivorans]